MSEKTYNVVAWNDDDESVSGEMRFGDHAVHFVAEGYVVDLAYADLCYDGYVAPSILQVEGSRDIAVEFFSMSKSYNMPGWRVGFCCGNKALVGALARIKSYLDYGMFTPVQVAAISALEGDQSCVEEIRQLYLSRRNVLCDGLNAAGWPVVPPRATMFVWAQIPEFYRDMGSLEFSKKLLTEAKAYIDKNCDT